MKFMSLCTFLLLTTSISVQAKIGNIDNLFGEYALNQKEKGNCSPVLMVIKKTFLNQSAEYSVAIYGYSSKADSHTNIIAQLANLNMGLVYSESQNPMLGTTTGIYYFSEKIDSNKIEAISRYTNLRGDIIWENKLNSWYDSKGIKIDFSSYNITSGAPTSEI